MRLDAVSRRPAARVAGHRQGSGSGCAAGFRAGRRDSPRAAAAIGEPGGWRIPRLTTAHYLISWPSVWPDARICRCGRAPSAPEHRAGQILRKPAGEAPRRRLSG